jgi:hypothetical protein
MRAAEFGNLEDNEEHIMGFQTDATKHHACILLHDSRITAGRLRRWNHVNAYTYPPAITNVLTHSHARFQGLYGQWLLDWLSPGMEGNFERPPDKLYGCKRPLYPGHRDHP